MSAKLLIHFWKLSSLAHWIVLLLKRVPYCYVYTFFFSFLLFTCLVRVFSAPLIFFSVVCVCVCCHINSSIKNVLVIRKWIEVFLCLGKRIMYANQLMAKGLPISTTAKQNNNKKKERRKKFTLWKIDREKVYAHNKCQSWKLFHNYVEGKLVVVEIMAAKCLVEKRNISCAFYAKIEDISFNSRIFSGKCLMSSTEKKNKRKRQKRTMEYGGWMR